MKKFAIFTLVLILVAATAVPVFAGDGTNNGQGNANNQGVGVGQGNGNGGDKDKDQDRDQNRDRDQDQDRDRDQDQIRDRDQDQIRDRDQDQYRDGSGQGSGKYKNQENTKWMYSPFYLQGTITALDTGTMTLTVNVIHANAKVKEFMGSDLSITANDSTQIFQITQGDEYSGTMGISSSSSTDLTDPGDGDEDGEPSNRIPITFDQLEVGQSVAIHGRLVDTTYTASLITVYITQPVEPPVGDNP